MPNTASISFSVTDISFSIASILKGVSCVQGITKRGPHTKADILVTSFAQFERLYGGLIPASNFPLLAKRALDRGSQLRVNRVGHYTDITDDSTLTADKAAVVPYTILTWDAAFVTDNDIDLEINTVAITQVEFLTDSNTTMGLLATEIASHADVDTAFVIDGGTGTDDDRVIIIVPLASTALALTSIVVTNGASQPNGVATAGDIKVIDALGNDLFSLTMKHAGLDYNNISVNIKAASNGDANFFDLEVVHSVESELNETYQNLTIPGTPTIAESIYLNTIEIGSQLIDVTYEDLSSLTSPIRPVNQVYQYAGGDDGDPVVAIDYVGDSAGGTGFNAFDGIDDALQVAVPEISDNAVHIGGAAYVENRKDMNYLAHLDNAASTTTALIAARDATLIDTRFVNFIAGGLRILDPATSVEKEISEMGDILAILSFNDTNFGEWFSPAGRTRGKIPNALGVVNNFGTPALLDDLNLLANRQINMVVVRDNTLFLVDFFTAQLANSKLSFGNHQRLLLFIQKSISPILGQFLEEPNDIPTFKAIFDTVEPFFDDLVTNRALFSFVWQGDQDIDTIDDVVVNNPTDLDNGKYKVKLFLKIVPTMKEIAINIIVTPTGVSFELA